MKRKKFKLLLSCLLAVSLLSNESLAVSAYSLFIYKHSSSKIYYSYDNWVNLRAVSFFSQGEAAWKATTAQAQILHKSLNPGTGFDVYMSAGNIADVGWDGLTTTFYEKSAPFYVTYQTVTLNMSQERTWNDDGALKSVIVHEMGHVFGLNDNGKNKTIMNGYTWGDNSRYEGYGLTAPQIDDVNGVNEKY